jgi:hypothetical protein
MANTGTDIGSKYNTKIPTLLENADIQTAFTLYHYGQDTEPATEDDLLDDSIAGYLNDLEGKKINKKPVLISGGTSFNSNIVTGYYLVSNLEVAATVAQLPPLNNVKYPGLLEVVAETESGVVYQTYHMVDGVQDGVNAKAWRAFYNSGWTDWRYASDDRHVHDTSVLVSGTLGVNRGGTGGNTPALARTSIGAQASSTGVSSSVVVTDSSGVITPSATITVPELNQLDGISTSSTIQTQLNSKPTSNIVNQKIFVQPTPPTAGVKTGDLWFW